MDGSFRPTVLSGVREVEEEVTDNVDDDNDRDHHFGDGDEDGTVLVAVPLDEHGEPILGRSPRIVGLLPPGDDGAAVVRRLSSGNLRFRPDGGGSGGGGASAGGTMGHSSGTLMRKTEKPSSADDVAEEELAISAGEPCVPTHDLCCDCAVRP